MKDDASIDTSRLTRDYHVYYEIIQIISPAHSPDLNPIENV